MTTVVSVEDDGPVRILTLNGASRLNSLAGSTAEALRDAIIAAERDPAVHALVLTGSGNHFSAGGDAEGVLAVELDESDDAYARFMRTYRMAAEAMWETPLPVVAAVAGIAYGGAFNLAMSCDLVIASRSARFCQVFMRRGVVPDFGGAFVLPRLIGLRKATELMLLADEIDAESACRLGLINEVTETPEQAFARALSLAHRLAAQPRLAVSMTKRMLRAGASGDFQTALEIEALSQATALSSRGARQAFQAFQER